jgi:hypothetical protein
MAKEDKLNAKIKESFEEAPKKAPANIWAALDQSLAETGPTDLDSKVRESFEHQEEKAPIGIWGGINKQLTIDSAWTGVNRYLRNRVIWLWTQRVALVLFFLLIGSYWIWTPQELIESQAIKHEFPRFKKEGFKPPITKSEDIINAKSLGTIAVDDDPTSTKKISPSNDDNIAIADSNSNIILDKDIKEAGSEVSALEGLSLRFETEANRRPVRGAETEIGDIAFFIKDSIMERPWKNFQLSRFPISDLTTALNSRDFSPTIKGVHNFRSWEIGLKYSYLRNYLDNNIYRESIDPRSLIKSNRVEQNQISLAVNYRLNSRWSLQTTWQPNQRISLNYNSYEEGQFIRNTLNLDYQMFTLGSQYNWVFNPYSSDHHITLGADLVYGVLKSASMGQIDLSASYTNFMGSQLRLGQEWHYNNLVFAYGLQGQFSVNNLFTGNARISRAFDRTNSRSYGLYLGLRYQL